MANTSNTKGTLTDNLEDLWQHAKSAGISRRNFLGLMAAGGTTSVIATCGDGKSSDTAGDGSNVPVAQIAIPPTEATFH